MFIIFIHIVRYTIAALLLKSTTTCYIMLKSINISASVQLSNWCLAGLQVTIIIYIN